MRKGVGGTMKRKVWCAVAVIAMSLLAGKPQAASAEQLYLIQGSGAGEMTVEQLLASYDTYSTAGRKLRNDLYLTCLEEQEGFYTEHRDMLTGIRRDRQAYAVLSEILNLAVLEKQREYYECGEALLVIKRRVAAVRKRYGISVATELRELWAEETEIANGTMEMKRAAEQTAELLRQEAGLGDRSLVLFYRTDWKDYDTEVVLRRFCDNSEACLQAAYLLSLYREQEPETVSEGELKEQAEAVEANYVLQEEISREQAEAYARELLAAYEETARGLAVAEERRSVCEEKYDAECRKRECGRATWQSALECRAELLQAEAEYLRCLGKKLLLEYALDRGVMSEN